MYAQISHQCMAGTLVELLQGHVGGADFGKYRLLHGFGHAVFIVGGGDAVGTDRYRAAEFLFLQEQVWHSRQF